MAVTLTLRLPPDASAPSRARSAASQLVGGQLHPERLSDLHLVVTELVSNAVVHGHGEVVLRLELDAHVIRGEVIDQGKGFEREVRTRGPEAVTGRGLMLVESLATRWGIHEGTTHVWFELPVVGDATPHAQKPALGEAERPDALG